MSTPADEPVDYPDPWTLTVPWDDADLAAERSHVIDHHGMPADVVFTCDDCARANVCVLAFDPYNTDGDCLYNK